MKEGVRGLARLDDTERAVVKRMWEWAGDLVQIAGNVESLHNPAGESQVLTETSDHEIYQAVMDAIDARENVEINGGDDVDNDIPLEPCPTRHDILKAISTMVDMWMT
jgi:hypothetical protein